MSPKSEPTRRWLLFVIPLLFFVWMVWINEAGASQYNAIAVEDGPLEWQQFFFDVFCATILFVAAARIGPRPRFLRWALLLAGLAFVFIAGEEISWGQRILGLGLPQYFAKHNVQDELNLHNLKPVEQEQGAYQMLGGFVLGLAWLTCSRTGRVLFAACIGIGVSWLYRQPLASLMLAGRAAAGRSPLVELGVLLIGAGAILAVVVMLLTWITRIHAGWLKKWLIPPWYLSLYFLPWGLFGLLERMRHEPAFLGALSGALHGFLEIHFNYNFEAAVESALAAGWLLLVLRIWQLVSHGSETDGS